MGNHMPATVTTPVHEHAWATESVHATSEGRIRYVRCTGCGTRRIDLDPGDATPPVALSRKVSDPSRAPENGRPPQTPDPAIHNNTDTTATTMR